MNQSRAAAVVVVLALALLGLPWVFGMVSAAQIEGRVASLDRQGPFGAQLASLERGWFSSTARIELRIVPDYLAQLGAVGDPALAALARPAVIVVSIAHGPIAMLGGVHLGLSKFTARLDPATPGLDALLQRLGIPYLFEFRGSTGFTGALAFDADFPAFDLDDPDVLIAFSGAQIDGSLAGADLVSHLRMDAFDLSSGSGRLSVQGLVAAGDHELRSSYLMLGTTDVSLQRVRAWAWLGGEEPSVDIAGARFDMEMRADDAFASGSVTYTIDTMVFDGVERLDDATLAITVGGIDVAALEAYATTAQRLALGTPGVDAFSELEVAIARLLAGSPSLSIDPLRLEWNGEPFTARIHVESDASALPPAAMLDIRDPTIWADFVTATADVEVSKVLAQEVAAAAIKMQGASFAPGEEPLPPDELDAMADAQASLMLATLAAQGLFSDNGENYSIALELREGAVTINGNPMPFGLP